MDAQAAAVLEAALAQEGIRVADLSNEELAAIVATMYSALGQQPPTSVGPVQDDNDEDADEDSHAEGAVESPDGTEGVAHAGGFGGLGDSHAADRSALDESPRGSRQPWMDSSELMGDSMPLSGRSPAAVSDRSPSPAAATGASTADRAEQRGGAIRSSDSAVQHAQLEYPPVDELFAGGADASEVSSRRTSEAGAATASRRTSAAGAATASRPTGTHHADPYATESAPPPQQQQPQQQLVEEAAVRRSVGPLDDYSRTRAGADGRGLYDDEDRDGGDDHRAVRGSYAGWRGAAAEAGNATSGTHDSTFGRPSMRGGGDRGSSVSAWPPAPLDGAAGRASAAAELGAGLRSSASAPLAAGMAAPPPPAPHNHAAAVASRGGTAPPSRRNSFGAGSAAVDSLATASAPAPYGAAGYGIYGSQSSEGIAGAGRRSIAPAGAVSDAALPPSRTATAAQQLMLAQTREQHSYHGSAASSSSTQNTAPAAAGDAAAGDAAADGYVSVLLSTLQTNAAAVAEAEAELRLVVRER